MYSVSNKYIQDMKQPSARFGIRGTVYNQSFTEANLAGGSFSITNSCVDNDEMLLGAAFIGEFRATFQDINIGRYDWVGKAITPIHVRKFGDGTEEEVPLGVFTIAEAIWSADGVSVIAYDNMAKLDKAAQFNATSGSAYGILQNICTACGVVLGMTQGQVEALPNGQQLFGCYPDNDITTYRDMVSWLAQALASVVLIDRSGRLILKTYGMVSVDTITAESRFDNSNFSDFVSQYSGLSITDIESKETRYYHTDDDRYLTMNLGANPFLQYGTKSTKDTMARASLNQLASVAYVPFQISMLGDPAYDLCDVLTNSGGLGDGTKAFCIQRFSWSMSGGYTAEGVGKNPDLANAKSKTDKKLDGIMSTVKSDQIQYYFFENSDEITINDTKTCEIIYLRFLALKQTTVIFHAEILLDADSTVSGINYNDIEGKVSYFLNLVEVQDYYPTETWVDGKHVLHLLYHIPIQEEQVVRFSVRLTANGGKIVIPAGGVQAIIHGQGLAATDVWDGYLDFEEKLHPVEFGTMTVDDNLTATATYWRDIPYNPSAAEYIGEIEFGSLEVEGFGDEIAFDFEEGE